MTIGQIKKALDKLGNDDTKILFALKQFNDVYPSTYIDLPSTAERDGFEMWLNSNGKDVIITLHLEGKSFISGKNRK